MGVGKFFANGRQSGWALFPASRKAGQNLKQNLCEGNRGNKTVKICGLEIWGSKEAHRCKTRFASTFALEDRSADSRRSKQMRSWKAEEILIDLRNWRAGDKNWSLVYISQGGKGPGKLRL